MKITAIELYHISIPLRETFWPTWIPEFRDGIIDPIVPDKDGMLHPFTKPGLGFEVRKDWLRKYGKRFFKLNETRLKLKVIREKGLKTALELKKRKES